MNTEPKRIDAKNAVIERKSDEPQFDQALFDAHKLQLEITKEQNSHERAVKKISLGKLGIFLGDGSNAPTFIAFISIILCFVLIFINLCLKIDGINASFISVITLALGYLFGRRSE